MTSPAKKQGDLGEALARRHLENKGMRFVQANWGCKTGEIDLIMKDGSTLVFVEVRLRAETKYGEGDETVAWQKIRKLIRTAQFWQQVNDYWGDIRFDVVSIGVKTDGGYGLKHIEAAFMEE
ncbi:MAG: YraN family protein [Candidatus Andersenbacteria bacterium]|nr:YraN family protein [bacterium]MDZ4225569.1 YraN family protein [Candidatus Andersenbacteria bacterium]